jgi:hypothetical protein
MYQTPNYSFHVPDSPASLFQQLKLVVDEIDAALAGVEGGTGGGAPSGPAGGDLTGLYPNPSLAAVFSGGSFSNANISVDTKGRVVAASNGSGGGVTSVFGRTGAVVAQTGDYNWNQISGTTLPAVSGQNLTNLNASNLSSGTIPDARFPTILPAVSGQNLTNIQASNIVGTLPASSFPALTGDVTTAAGSTVTAIGAGKVTNAMLAGSITASKLVGSDIATVGTITTGVWRGTKIDVPYGGTNLSSYLVGDLIYASATNILTTLIATTAGNALISGTLPSWGKIGLTTHVSGVLPPANGGTGTSTVLTQGSVVFAGVSGVFSQNNANFFWNDTTQRLGIGTATPQTKLHVVGDVFIDSPVANLFLKTTSTGWSCATPNVVILANTNNALQSSSFTSGSRGWGINDLGDAEFNNIQARGEFRASVFKVNEISATAGTFGVFYSASNLAADCVTSGIGSTFTFSAKNSDVTSQAMMFGLGDIVRIKSYVVGPFVPFSYFWKLDNRNDSIANNSLLDAGTTTPFTAGKIGNAAHFTSVSGQYLYANATDSAGGSWCLSFWFRNPAGDQWIVTKWTGSGVGFGLISSKSTNQISGQWNGANYPTAPCTGDNNWHHVLLWYDATTGYMTFRVDNGGLNSWNFGPLIADSGPLVLGAYPGFPTFSTVDIDAVGWGKFVPSTSQQDYLWNSGAGREIATQVFIGDAWAAIEAPRTNNGAATLYTARMKSGSTYTTFRAGTAVVDYGLQGTGFITLSTDGTVGATPNMTMANHNGAPWTGFTTATRVGNLNGSYGYATDVYGLGAGQYGINATLAYSAANVTGGTYTAGVFTKTASSTWGNAGFSSSVTLTGDGYLEWSPVQLTTDISVGFSTADPDANYSSIQFNLHHGSDQNVYIFESGTQVGATGSWGTWTTSTVLRLQRNGTTMTYWRDNTLLRTTTCTTAPLYLDVAVYQTNAKVGPIRLVTLGVGLPLSAISGGWLTADDTNGIRIGSGVTTRIQLRNDGSGFLASDNIKWDTLGNAQIAGWTINANSLQKGVVKIAAGVDFTNAALAPEAWFGVSSNGITGLCIKGSTVAAFQMGASNPFLPTGGRPYLIINDDTSTSAYRILIGELNYAWRGDGATASMGMKIWSGPSLTQPDGTTLPAGSKIVEFSDVQNVIAGWSIGQTKIGSNGVSLNSGASAGLGFGTTPPTSAVLGTPTGTGVWIDRSGVYGLATSVIQTKIDATSGYITAGAGNVLLTGNGIQIVGNTSGAFAINKSYGFVQSAGASTAISGLWGGIFGGVNSIVLEALSVAGSGSQTAVKATAPAGFEASIYLQTDKGGTLGPSILLTTSAISDGYVLLNPQQIGGLYKFYFHKNGMSLSNDGTLTAGCALEVRSTTGAFMPPRLTNTQRGALTPIAGMVVFNTDRQMPSLYANNAWRDLVGGVSAKVSNSAASFSVPSGSTTLINFDFAWWDTDAMWTAANMPRLTCKVPGVYFIQAALTINADGVGTGYRQLQLAFNGALLVTDIKTRPHPTTSESLQVNCLWTLAVGDYVTVSVFQNSGVGLTINASNGASDRSGAYLSMVKVG